MKLPLGYDNFKVLIDKQLDFAAQQALEQIDLQNYVTEAKQRGRIKIIKIGLAFCGKRFKLLARLLSDTKLAKNFPQ